MDGEIIKMLPLLNKIQPINNKFENTTTPPKKENAGQRPTREPFLTPKPSDDVYSQIYPTVPTRKKEKHFAKIGIHYRRKEKHSLLPARTT